MFYEIDRIPNQTEEACSLQLAQHAAWDAVYDAYEKADVELSAAERWLTPAVQAAQRAYEDTVAALTRLFGENAYCWQVDEDLWSFFSDVYKNDVGTRPSDNWTRVQVKAWIDSHKSQGAIILAA